MEIVVTLAIPLISASYMVRKRLNSLAASIHFPRLLNFARMIEMPLLLSQGEAVPLGFRFCSLACSLNPQPRDPPLLT